MATQWVLPNDGSLILLTSKLLIDIFYLKNFRREEQNFVVQNQIDNMAVLTADKNAKPNAASILVS